MKKAAPFATEAELCKVFIENIGEDWIAYPETAGWDILLVRKADGFQIGVEAKLALNAKVFSQALEGDGWAYWDQGPDCRAVLVPEGKSGGFYVIAQHLALTIITVRSDLDWRWNKRFLPTLPKIEALYDKGNEWHELCPIKRCEIPDYIPDVAAGAPAPIQLTQWKVKAIKIAVLIETRGFVTRADFKELGIDPRRWRDGRWVVAAPEGLVAGPGIPDFKGQHPKTYGEIKADIETWRPKNTPLAMAQATQEALL